MKEEELHPLTREYYKNRTMYFPNYIGEKEEVKKGLYTSAYEKEIEYLDRFESTLDYAQRKILYEEIILNEEECIRYTQSRISIMDLTPKKEGDIYPTKERFQEYIVSGELLIEHCKAKLKLLSNREIEIEIKTPSIFKDKHAYNLFLKWHEHFKLDKNIVANYSYIIRKMVDEDLMHDVKLIKYKDFLNSLGVDIGNKIKTISECETDDKKKLYLELYQLVYIKK